MSAGTVGVRRRASTDLRPAHRWLAALLLPIGPVAIALLRFLLPYDTVDDAATIVGKATAEPASLSLVLWLSFVGVLTLVPGVLAVGRLTRRRAQRLTAAALLLLVPGYLALGWMTATDLLLWSGATADVGDRSVLVALHEAAHPTSGLSIGIFVVGHVVGTVLLGVAMWHSRVVPRWAAVVTAVSQPLHFVAAMIVVSHSLDLFAWGLNAVGFAVAAVAVVRTADDDWDLPAE